MLTNDKEFTFEQILELSSKNLLNNLFNLLNWLQEHPKENHSLRK